MPDNIVELIAKIIGLAFVFAVYYFLGFEVAALVVLTAIYQEMPKKSNKY